MSVNLEKIDDSSVPYPASPSSSSSLDGEDQLQRTTTEKQTDGAYDNASLARTKSIAESLSLPHEIAFVSLVCMAQFFTQASLGQGISIINVVGKDFGITHHGELAWILAGYSLTVGTFILISGRMGDLFGYKRMLLIGFAWFSLWSMVAGLAVYSNYILFVFARVLQGIGAAIVMPNSLAILGATYPPGKRKAMVFAIFGACAPNGSIAGAAMAGVLALAWWPWAYWVEAIALAVIVILTHLIIPDPPKKEDAALSFREKVRHLDPLGSITGVAALVLINFAWNQAPIVGWQQPYVYVVLLIGILFMPAFFYIELRVAQHPLIPFHAFSADVSFVLGAVGCGWGCFGIWFFYTWSFFLNLRHATPLLATAWVSPVCPSGAIAAICTGWMLGHCKPGLVMTLSLAAFLVGTILIMTAPVDQIYWGQAFFSTVVTPWGMDMSFPAATLILSNAVAKEHQGIAASLVNTIVNYSISLGLGFAGTVEVHVNNGGHTPDDLLTGYRGALYIAAGIAALGLGISAIYLAKDHWRDYQRKQVARELDGDGKA